MYKRQILFGTCSKGDTFSTLHCVFDKNVENGSLVLRIKKPYEKGDKVNTVYKMSTTWHLQKPDVALGVITSTDNHFQYKSEASEDELSLVGYSILNDLTGAPKFPTGKKALGKVYAMTLPTAKTFPKGIVKIELAENPPAESQIARYSESANSWEMLQTKIEGSSLISESSGSGIFAVFASEL